MSGKYYVEKKCSLLTVSIIQVKALLEVLLRMCSNTLCLFWCSKADSLHRGKSVPFSSPSLPLSLTFTCLLPLPLLFMERN